jgi:hypothetical protein
MRIAFYVGPTNFFGKLVRLWRRSNISHVEIILSNGIALTSDPTRGGVVIYSWDSSPENEKNWTFLDVEISKKSENKIFEFAQAENPAKYDWAGILFTQFFNFGWESRSKWFCSEFCSAALKLVFPTSLKETQPHRVAPDELYSLLLERKIGFPEPRN